MTVNDEFISCIMIVFVLVSPVWSITEEGSNGYCYTNMSIEQSRLSETQVPKTGFSAFFASLTFSKQTETVIKTEFYKIWMIKKICCKDYEHNNKTCVPKCSSKCNNGYCAQPNICACNYGWEGDFCDEPRLCSIRINYTEKPNELPASDDNMDVSENPGFVWQGSECDSKCHDQLRSTAINVTRSADMIYYFFPIDSLCNSSTVKSNFLKDSSVIGAVIVIVLLAIIIYAVYIVRKKLGPRRKISNQSIQCAYTNYIEENPIYSSN